MAVVFSIPTPPIHLKIRLHLRTSSNCSAIFAIGAGLTHTLGPMTGSPKHGWAVLAAMVFFASRAVLTAYWAESRGNPILPASALTSS